jgi:glycogen synthase
MYGGAGIHVAYLSRELAKLCKVDVRCFGSQRVRKGSLTATGYAADERAYKCPPPLNHVFGAFRRCLDFNTSGIDADIVHCHTWYTHLGGILAKLNYSIPLVVTTHSLEPLRPWKREQLAGGYNCSLWVERAALEMADAVVAVSKEARKDIMRLFRVDPGRIHVIHNGIDIDEYRPAGKPATLRRLGIDVSRPYVLFVGRITRQKGIAHLVNAIRYMDGDFQVVLCAGAPDTPEIAARMRRAIREAGRRRRGVVWIQQMLDTPDKVALYSGASVFICPSIYEPFGIINLEAMACEVPVVASAVGGIKEVVVDGVTGVLVAAKQAGAGSFELASPHEFERGLAAGVNRLMRNAPLRLRMGKAGRRRAIENFGWPAIAKRTFDLYRSLV